MLTNIRQGIRTIAIRLGLYESLRKTNRIVRRKFLTPYRTRRFYRQFVPSGSLCFDVGANVGLRTHALLALGATVVAIEPQRECYLALRRQFGENQNVIIEPVALGSEPGTGQLGLVDGASALASLAEAWRSQGPFAHLFSPKTETVNITTLDTLISRHGMPAFIKIDVEGYESQVLSGLHQAPSYVSFEFVAQLIKNAKECIRILDALGFTEYNYSSGETMKWQFPRWVSGRELISLLAQSGAHPSEWGDIYAHYTHA